MDFSAAQLFNLLSSELESKQELYLPKNFFFGYSNLIFKKWYQKKDEQ